MITFLDVDGLKHAHSTEEKARASAVSRRMRGAQAKDHDGKAVDMKTVDAAVAALDAAEVGEEK